MTRKAPRPVEASLTRTVIASPAEFLRASALDSGDLFGNVRGSSAFGLQTVVSRGRQEVLLAAPKRFRSRFLGWSALKLFLLIFSVLASSGCIRDSVKGGGGAPNFLSTFREEFRRQLKLLQQESATAESTMNFYLDFSESVNVWKNRESVNEVRAKEFLRVGITEISSALGIESDWEIELEPANIEADAIDMTFQANIYSPESSSLTWSSATDLGRAVLECDRRFSEQREYRIKLSSAVDAIVRRERPNRIEFKVALFTEIRGKSWFATDDHYEWVSGIRSRKAEAFKGLLETALLKEYKTYLQESGLMVTAGRRVAR